jgi:Glyoxalase-like domain
MAAPGFRPSGIVLDSPNAQELADFYHRLLGWPYTANRPGWCKLQAPAGPGLSFQDEPLFQRPTWPSASDQQQMMIHLDLEVEDLEVAGAYAIEQGATKAEFQPQDDVQVYLDPAGHPFCIWVRPQNFHAA